ncbi:hypothetical protein ACIP6P_23350 [Streptomyces sp. NPDC088729]|uniref:hypothetical protein n=1 Tax=Streptomyces sp. NPDC088729 TaxID=3365876 RepID=UPI003825209C
MRSAAQHRTGRNRRLEAGASTVALVVFLALPGAVAGTAFAADRAPRQDTAVQTNAIELGSWMDQLKGTIGDRPLNQIVMPGSHDAGTSTITEDSGICSYGESAEASRAWPGVAASMSRTQSGSLVEQLDGGSRYLDLRLCKQGDKWFTYHGGPLGRQFFDSTGAGGTVRGEVNELADWIGRHPKEIVIVRLTTAVPPETAAADSRAAVDALGNALGGGAGKPAIADGSLKPTSTYNQFVSAGKHVVIVDDTKSTNYPWAWQQGQVQDYRGSYVGVSSDWQDILKGTLDPRTAQKTFDAVLKRGDEVLGRAPGASADKFFVLQGIIDPTHSIGAAAMLQIAEKLKLVPSDVADNFLLTLERELNRQMLGKMRSTWNHANVTDNMNIVMTDDVNQNTNGVRSGELQREIISKNLPQHATPHTFLSTGRSANGTWTAPSPLSGAGDSFRYVGSRQAVSATPDGGVQVLGIGLDGNIWHNIRGANGTWQGWNALPAADNKKVGFAATDIAITGLPDGSAQIAAVGKDGYAYHNIRRADGSWQGWAAIAGTDAGRLKAGRIAAAGMPDGSARFLVFGGDGRMRMGIRAAGGSWSPWSTVAGVNAPDFAGRELSIAALPNGDSQIAAIGNDGNIWHTIRRADGSWQGWNGPAGVSTDMMGASSVAITGMPGGDSQVAAVGLDGNVYHAVRRSGGEWTPFRPVGGAGGAAYVAGDQVGIAGLPDGSSRIVLTTR